MIWLAALLVAVVLVVSVLLSRRRKGYEESRDFEPCTPVDLINALIAKRGSKDSNCLTHLLSLKKIILVDDIQQLPTGCVMDGASCFLEGKTYVVAPLIDRNSALRDFAKEGKKHHVRQPHDLGGISWR